MPPPPSSKGVPPSPETSPLPPAPPLDWAHLTETCLLRIFAYLPQADLRRMVHVCRHWAIRQKSALKSTKELTVFIGGKEAESLLLGEAFPSHALDTFQRKIAFSCVHLANVKPPTIKQLLRVYPNVTHLCLSACEIKGKHASRLVAILRGLSSNLLKLHLVVTFKVGTDYDLELAASLELLGAVKALPHLKVLTFHLDFSLINEDDGHLTLPFLARLHEFNFKTQDDAKDLVQSFSNFASGNASLQTIRLESWTPDASSWELYLKLNSRLLAAFKHLKVLWQVREHENPPFKRLFPLLTSLTQLEFSINGESQEETQYRDTVATLATLKSLKELKLVIASNLPPGQPEVPVGLFQLATVRKLTLELYADSHKEDLLGPCYLDWVFPCLEEVNLNFIIRGCSECDFLNFPVSFEEAKRCANKLYARQVRKLKKLLSLKKKVVTFSWERQFPDKRWSTSELGITA